MILEVGLALPSFGEGECPTGNEMIVLSVAIVNVVYPPEPVISAQMVQDLVGYLANFEASVTVLHPYPLREYCNGSSGVRIE